MRRATSSLPASLALPGCALKRLLELGNATPRFGGLRDSRAAEDDDRMLDAVAPQVNFRLLVVECQARAARIPAVEELFVEIGALIRRARHDRLDARECVRVFFDRLRLLPRQRLAAFPRIRRRGNLPGLFTRAFRSSF